MEKWPTHTKCHLISLCSLRADFYHWTLARWGFFPADHKGLQSKANPHKLSLFMLSSSTLPGASPLWQSALMGQAKGSYLCVGLHWFQSLIGNHSAKLFLHIVRSQKKHWDHWHLLLIVNLFNSSSLIRPCKKTSAQMKMSMPYIISKVELLARWPSDKHPITWSVVSSSQAK